MSLLEKLVAAIIVIFLATMVPSAVVSLDTATHSVSSLLGLLQDPETDSTPSDVPGRPPLAGKIRDVIDELLRE